MPHNSSPLQILDHRFLAFECRATEGEKTDGALALRTQPEVSQNPEDPLSWQVVLTVEFVPEDEKHPSTYHGMIKVSGEFGIHESFTEKNREALIRVTAVSILYGACREFLAGFTARSVNGILSLPSISFRKPPSPTKATKATETEDENE